MKEVLVNVVNSKRIVIGQAISVYHMSLDIIIAATLKSVLYTFLFTDQSFTEIE